VAAERIPSITISPHLPQSLHLLDTLYEEAYYRAAATALKRPAATKVAATMLVSRGTEVVPAVPMTWDNDNEEVVNVPFAVAVGVTTPAVESIDLHHVQFNLC
jgi:hypothetical protein